jgi:hypothetical protein
VKLVQGQPLRRRVEEIRERESQRGSIRVETAPGQAENRQRAERDRRRLHHE